MKRFFYSMGLTLLLTALAACSSSSGTSTPPSSTPPVSHGEAVRTFESKVEDSQGNGAVLKAYKNGNPDSEGIWGIGQIKADGSFIFEFDKTVDISDRAFFLCGEDMRKNENSISGFRVSDISIQMAGKDDDASREGILFLGKKDAGTNVESGEIHWIYAEEDTDVNRTCEGGSTVDVTLKAGWNTVVGTFDESTQTNPNSEKEDQCESLF